ncbi:MAG: CDP-glucose 4,6-dehydratase [Spirochaetaceae bacterium]|jgi:CDP-glucose 4,6-dehydratase|nr:CDP-glucose 4,6-dehydratase [Spirochaetaceae bacterium]
MTRFYAGKRVFITGATGFKGAWLCHTLLAAGAEITGYALAPETPSLFSETGLEAAIKTHYSDIRDREKLCAAVFAAKPDVVFHLAAQPLVRRSYRESALTYETNVMGTVNLLEAARSCPSVRSIVNITTDKVYENREWPWPYRETDLLDGFDPYSNSKSCSELVSSCYRHSFFCTEGAAALSTARSGNVIGGGDYAEDRIIPDCVRAASSDRRIIVRNPASIRPYQHVLECIAGYLILAEKQCADRTISGAYNFGPDEENCVSTGNLAELFCKAWGGGASWIAKPGDGPHEAQTLKLDCSKSKALLEWKPRWNIQQTIAETVELEKTPAAGRAKVILNQLARYQSSLF